ncbi:DNA ligase 3-like isoform X2 [Rhopilema esculentum]|uniref:DNA ligase 3-like isoform X2 n=1 Tax=Rhopilema esculentum TaxID=499914 RepID=UPI0031D50752
MADNNGISFEEFWKLCKRLANEPSYNMKTEIIKQFVEQKASKDASQDQLFVLVKMLLPGVHKRVYNLKDKQIVKLFSQVFNINCEEMVKDLEKGDASKTVKDFFKRSNGVIPCKTSSLSLIEVDELLDQLVSLTKEDEQYPILKKISKRCTTEDLKFIVRLIKHDLRMNTGVKHVLHALDKNAYAAYQACSNLQDVVEKLSKRKIADMPGLQKSLSIKASLMTPVKPMLAEACKSTTFAMKKCPNGMLAEIKYDGERVQVHKKGNSFDYFSRSFKPVQPHKVSEIKHFLPKACPEGDNLILDGEVLLVDSKTEKPLPFGTLGIHKKSKFKDATVCYVIFDILQFNEDNTMKRSVLERRDLLMKNVKEIKGRIMLSEMTRITRESELKAMLEDVFAKNLEGLVLKDLKSTYEPGKRHWLKMKKDYLHEGAIADTADLVVLGAYFGTGNKGGMMSVFLMGCYNPAGKKWVTVAKCGNGHDDSTILRLQKELKVKKISKEYSKIPSWLEISKQLVPDFVVEDPKTAPVWEITGAEFSQSSTHTANGISIRFPRVTRIRDDKDWETATDLPTLQKLYENSKAVSEDQSRPGTSKAVEIKADDAVYIDRKDRQKDPGYTKGDTKVKRIYKRAFNDDSDEDKSPPPKKVKPLCKYKEKCYQKSKKHLEEYSHPEKPLSSLAESSLAESSMAESSMASSNPSRLSSQKNLPAIFSSTQVFISDDISSFNKLKRYIIAYDGDIVDEFHLEKATHYITNSQVSISSHTSAILVNEDWVWDSVRIAVLQDESNYFPGSI